MDSEGKKVASSSEILEEEQYPFATPKIGITTLEKYLQTLTTLPKEEFAKFGVSEAVLKGLVNVNQFVQVERNFRSKNKKFIIDQQYLLHCFARFCGLILPRGSAKGLDLIIPVFRTDTLMSCVVIQVKNLAARTFPANTSTDVMSKLGLDYLNFGVIGEFKAAPKDDFVRIVIQFSELKQATRHFDWKKLTGDKHALWLLGLKAFENLFFNDAGILNRPAKFLQFGFIPGCAGTNFASNYTSRCRNVILRGSFIDFLRKSCR